MQDICVKNILFSYYLFTGRARFMRGRNSFVIIWSTENVVIIGVDLEIVTVYIYKYIIAHNKLQR